MDKTSSPLIRDWIIEEIPSSTIPSVILEDDEALQDQPESGSYRDFSSNSFERDQLQRVPQQVITGRTGELVAFNFFSGKLGEEKRVRWVNEVKESGLPYDIVVEGNNNSKEYIEVKATSNARKDWFEITVREWQFAVEKGELFSIARVVLSDGKLAHITTYRNPVKLCQSGDLQLAIRSSK